MIEFHADDYGLFPEQSKRILDCCENGVLNGVSIMPNSSYLRECMEMVAPYKDRLAITVHLNFMEGKALTPHDEIPDLTNEDGIFNISFGKMTIGSYNLFVRRRLKNQIKKELKAQIDACMPYLDSEHVRLDGHGHYHMVPVLFDALVETILENDYHVSFIRFPEENVTLYANHKAEIGQSLLPINRIKVIVLNTFGKRNRRKYADFIQRLESFKFMGVMLSGHMSYENVNPLMNDAKKWAADENANLEVLFHPGSVLEQERINELTNAGDVEFLPSEWRAKEADALKRLIRQGENN